jgi:hypothetical protein
LNKAIHELLTAQGLDYLVMGNQIVVKRRILIPAGSIRLIRGRVMDEQSALPLNLASVSVKGKAIGTMTNADGIFEFHVPTEYADDTLVVSMLGYSGYSKHIRYLGPEFLNVTLKESAIALKEVVITGDSISANRIFKKAYENLQRNFPQDPYLLKGFFRQINTENGKNVLLIESVIELYDKEYKLNPDFKLKEKVSVRQVRSSKNYFTHTDRNFFDYANTLKNLLVWNFTRYENPYVMPRTNFVLDTIVIAGDRPVYVISSISQKHTGATLEGTNRFTFHIDCENFAFIRIKNETIAEKGYYLPIRPVPIKGDRSKVLRFTQSAQSYFFRAYRGKMYLEHASGYLKAHILDTETRTVEREVADEEILIINEILTENVLAPTENLIQNKKNVKYLSKGYDAAFWNDYEQGKLVPLTLKQINELEWEMSLEEQFHFTGKAAN